MKIFLIITIFIFQSSLAWSWSGKDFGEELASPWTTKARNVVIAGAVLTVAAIVVEDSTDQGQNEVVEDRPLGSLSHYGDLAGQMVPNFAYIIGQSALGLSDNKLARERALGMFKATAYAAGVTTALKYTIREPRPDNHNERNSFPSGHSTTAFAFGGYVLAEHGWQWGIPALAISTLSGLSRINDNRHRSQDVIAGATIGLGYGMGIAYLAKKNSSLSSFNLIPIIESDIKALVVSKDF